MAEKEYGRRCQAGGMGIVTGACYWRVCEETIVQEGAFEEKMDETVEEVPDENYA